MGNILKSKAGREASAGISYVALPSVSTNVGSVREYYEYNFHFAIGSDLTTRKDRA
jgi:hypothetical protein